jgi:hypothetical protein
MTNRLEVFLGSRFPRSEALDMFDELSAKRDMSSEKEDVKRP